MQSQRRINGWFNRTACSRCSNLCQKDPTIFDSMMSHEIRSDVFFIHGSLSAPQELCRIHLGIHALRVRRRHPWDPEAWGRGSQVQSTSELGKGLGALDVNFLQVGQHIIPQDISHGVVKGTTRLGVFSIPLSSVARSNCLEIVWVYVMVWSASRLFQIFHSMRFL